MGTWRVLVAYASRLGSTREIAQTIAQVLTRRGAVVDVLAVDQVKCLQGYQAVILGSPIREAHWLPEAIDFVWTHREVLQQLPVVYFVVSGLMSNPTPEHFHEVYACLAEVRALAEPLEMGIFAGSLEYDRLERDQVVKVLSKGLPEGDFRRWQEVRAWAEDIADRLLLELARKQAAESAKPKPPA
ncbi:flavodoxin domain-containing protein [Meiothermus hypogaeus]|uniref:Flavodoxin n=2 Tax=Meiothermus hypogaeus TaxID=884155 RepID=A0A511R0L5_9DEIN|nr:flavodoxin domain-containing protein [Meiothermus hypogaeus]RIH77410.1 Protoporphyrinogen IX dehydrogenase [menaquinone] [Meiothermus hypogaeus]GEM82352.1 flavodoxin [Meiothermus hypogaeus NBRC 106114]GIW37236.1 MAG: flavodoxin [Meiothermus sp.]